MFVERRNIMDANKFMACVNRLYILQVIHLTFNPGNDSIVGLRRLISLIRSKPRVRIEQFSLAPLITVAESGDWQNVSRTVAVYGLMHAEQNLLAALARDVEKVAVSDHGAKALFTSNKKRQEETAAEIIRRVVDSSLVAEVTSWGGKNIRQAR
jgi:hypothetical protein